jgi:LPXTG-site transpeptidase (sortase) family protein
MCSFQRFVQWGISARNVLSLRVFCNGRHTSTGTQAYIHGGEVAPVESTRVPVPPRRPPSRVALHAVGNIFIGMALGLASYYFVTDFVTGREQGAMREEMADLGSMGAPSPDRLVIEEVEEPEPELTGWETWRSEDYAYWAGLQVGDVFGRLVIEAMDLDAAVVLGTGTDELKKGPGWIRYSDLPGETGNAGIAGHRTTYGAPFRRLDDLEPGDIIHFYSPYRRYTYEVAEKLTVTPEQVEVMRTTEEPQITLSACHPPYSARYRLIIKAKLVEMQRLEDTPGAPTS